MPHRAERVTHVVGSNGIGPGHFGHELEPWLGRRAPVNMASDHLARLLSRRWLCVDGLHHSDLVVAVSDTPQTAAMRRSITMRT